MSQASNHTGRRWFQFGLKELLGLLTIAGIGLAILLRWHHQAVQQRDAVATIISDGFSSVTYEQNFDPANDPLPGPRWVGGRVDFNHFYKVVAVDLMNATDEQLRCLKDLPNVESLDLWDSNDKESSIGHISTLKNLKLLSLLGPNPALNDRDIATICSMKRLESLGLECGDKVTDVGIATIGSRSNLKTLRLVCGFPISDRGLANLGRLSNLEHLTLDLNSDSNVAVSYVPSLTSPSSFVLRIERPARGRSPTWLGELKHLISLQVVGGGVIDEATASRLSQMDSLRKLVLKANAGLSDDVLAHWGKLASLEMLVLDCEEGDETDAGLAHLASAPNLRRLELQLGENVNNAGLAALSDCASLRRLKLHLNGQVTGEGLLQLARLEYLHLDFKTRPNDSPSFDLRVANNLDDLVIYGFSSLNDEDLAGLAEHTKLQRLDLFWCQQVKDAGLEHLKHLSQLKELGIHWCERITAAKISALQTSLPNCKIDVMHGGGSFGWVDRFGQ